MLLRVGCNEYVVTVKAIDNDDVDDW